MNKILTTLIGTSLLAGALYAGQHTSKGNNTNSHCNSSVASDKNSNMSKTALDLLQESLAQNDLYGDG